MFLPSIYRFYIEALIQKYLFDGPIIKPQQSSVRFQNNKMKLERKLLKVNQQNKLKKAECSHYIKRWVRKTAISFE